jgi:DNA polymerase III alpha subunit
LEPPLDARGLVLRLGFQSVKGLHADAGARIEAKQQRGPFLSVAVTALELTKLPNGKRVKLGGLVLVRQRPATAKGFTFLSLEDETGIANLVVEPKYFEKYRREISNTALVVSHGPVERSGAVVNLKVDHLEALRFSEASTPASVEPGTSSS